MVGERLHQKRFPMIRIEIIPAGKSVNPYLSMLDHLYRTRGWDLQFTPIGIQASI